MGNAEWGCRFAPCWCVCVKGSRFPSGMERWSCFQAAAGRAYNPLTPQAAAGNKTTYSINSVESSISRRESAAASLRSQIADSAKLMWNVECGMMVQRKQHRRQKALTCVSSLCRRCWLLACCLLAHGLPSRRGEP